MQEYIKGRGAQINPHNNFLRNEYNRDFAEAIDEWETGSTSTKYFEENGKSILNKVTSPDIPIDYSLNPYQGCEHGCIYCYARNSHEYWGYSAGLDFEQKIIVKKKAATLLRQKFSSKSWIPTPISLSGNTDCYQPIERKLKITRQLLEVCWEYKNPVGIITKNSLILRDIDILQDMAKHNLVSVYVSITSTDELLRRKLEPRTSTYQQRLHILKTLSEAGIHTGVMNAPIIPGINDHHMHDVLKRASAMGAKTAGYTIVRLNGAIGEIFKNWLEHTFPDRAGKVLALIKECHAGKLNDSRFGTRMRGEGNIAAIIHEQFGMYTKKFGLNKTTFSYNISDFVRLKAGQLQLF